jgi:hypothetical protein
MVEAGHVRDNGIDGGVAEGMILAEGVEENDV